MYNMLKKIISFFYLSFILLFSSYFAWIDNSFAWVVNIEWTSEIEDVSIESADWGFVENINDTWFSLLWSLKTILMWVFVFYMVYAWAQMIMSMWTNEEKIKSSKRQIWYALIWIIFINIPWTIYEAFFKGSSGWNSGSVNWTSDWIWTLVWSSFMTFIKYLVWLLEVLIFFIALFIFVYTWLKLIIWWKDSKVVNEAKLKILYSIVALILVWFIEVWKDFAFSWTISTWVSIFSAIANLLLYITPLIALFFLTLAWYYYITSNWDKEKVKKAKDIIIYILLWTLIFLASYTIILELNTFKI